MFITVTILEKVIERKIVFWFSLQIVSETFFVLRISKRIIINKCKHVFNVKYPLFLLDFTETLIISTDFFSNNFQIYNFMKVRPVAPEFFHADR